MPFVNVRVDRDGESEVWLDCFKGQEPDGLVIGSGKERLEALGEAKQELEDRLGEVRNLIIEERAKES